MDRLSVNARYVKDLMAMLHLEAPDPVLQQLAEALETQREALGGRDPAEADDVDPELTFDPRWRT